MIKTPASRSKKSSPSSRRAWIEIYKPFGFSLRYYVALLAEGVDRNKTLKTAMTAISVALLAEGVDRNPLLSAYLSGWWSRPPRGGRG